MFTHKNARGKTACRLEPSKRVVELVQKNVRTVVQFNDDRSADVINYRDDGTVEKTHYPASV